MSRFSGTLGAAHSLSSARGIKRKREFSHLPIDSINPLSHSPAVLKEFRTAGFPNTEPLPSDSVPDFPHRPWRDGESTTVPGSARSGSPTESTRMAFPPAATSIQKGAHGKDKLRSSLRECVQLCLERGDVCRAKKAMTGLALVENGSSQAHSDTRPWSLRAEFIMSGGEQNLQSGQQSEDENERTQLRGWDSNKTMPKLREYLSSLIGEQSEGIANAGSAPLLSIWQALLSAELYGSSEKDSPARHAEHQDGEVPDDESDLGSADVFGSGEEPSSHPEARLLDENRTRGTGVLEGQARDAAIETAEMAIRHLGRLVHSKPYKTDQSILHLYAAALLFLADLKVPPGHDLQAERSGTRLERESLRNQAKGILDGIIRLGGRIDHRLQRIFYVGGRPPSVFVD